MQSSYISTLSWTSSSLNAIPRIQTEIAKANTEVATGRLADVGLTLGVRTSHSVDLRTERNSLQGLVDGNSLIDGMTTRTQTALSAMTTTSNSFLENLLSGQATAGTAPQLETEARAALSSFSAALNSTDGTRYVFGGVNSSETPIKDYDTTAAAAVNAAFAAKFGLSTTDPQNDPKVADITADQMQDFLDNEFADIFADPNWGTNFSNASDEAITKQISPTERATVSVSANDQAMRKLTMAFTMVGYLGVQNMNSNALQAVMDTARTAVTEGVTGLTAAAASIGVTQTRVKAATTQMQGTLDVVNSRISTLEGVDTAEAKTRLDALTNQLSMSYSTTSTLMKLSILNYA